LENAAEGLPPAHATSAENAGGKRKQPLAYTLPPAGFALKINVFQRRKNERLFYPLEQKLMIFPQNTRKWGRLVLPEPP
jgi:hypothetical protein